MVYPQGGCLRSYGFHQSNKAGLSGISPTAVLVPYRGPNWTVGLGSSVVLPAGDQPIGSGKVSAGPAFLAFLHRGPWIVGAWMRNVWSLAGDSERDDINRLVVRGLLRYQLDRSWYLISSPLISSDWTQPEGKGWMVPMQVSLEAYYNAVKPQFAGEELLGDWTVRTQWQVLFPN